MTNTKSLSERPDVAKLNSAPTASETLRGWAKAYRETPEYRFPSDPNAEFFPQDLDLAADALDAKDVLLAESRACFAMADKYVGDLQALLAQAAVALEEVTEWWDSEPHRTEGPDFVISARKALAAIRAKAPANE